MHVSAITSVAIGQHSQFDSHWVTCSFKVGFNIKKGKENKKQ